MSEEATKQAPLNEVALQDAASTRGEVAQPARRTLLAMTAAAGAGALILGASPGQADILRGLKGFLYLNPLVVNFAFEMEDLGRQFFNRVLMSSVYSELSPTEQNAFALIAKEDTEHYDMLQGYRDKLGIKAGGHFETPNASTGGRPQGKFYFPSKAFDDRRVLYNTSLKIKETSLFAYHGAVDLVEKDTLMLAAAIAGVEGRHLAVLRKMVGLDPVPNPFEGNLQSGAAGQRLARYGFKGGGYGNRF